LHLRRAGIVRLPPKVPDQFLFPLFGNGHLLPRRFHLGWLDTLRGEAPSSYRVCLNSSCLCSVTIYNTISLSFPCSFAIRGGSPEKKNCKLPSE
jgi:hypothetical protein